ncbi:type IV conjugative transfer system protein TraE [Acinetobacter baumannii]|uniref:type IV conjugative transfer system protein TraE n=1 Tax=Acinetobacter baumannii TaxID=470 RepID=UPI001D186403|nr:type IV conjugative transfer system protein TraE [Acinetobacter baumannii]
MIFFFNRLTYFINNCKYCTCTEWQNNKLNLRIISGPTYILGSTSANKEYYLDFSNYVINYLFNVTPINVSKTLKKF